MIFHREELNLDTNQGHHIEVKPRSLSRAGDSVLVFPYHGERFSIYRLPQDSRHPKRFLYILAAFLYIEPDLSHYALIIVIYGSDNEMSSWTLALSTIVNPESGHPPAIINVRMLSYADASNMPRSVRPRLRTYLAMETKE